MMRLWSLSCYVLLYLSAANKDVVVASTNVPPTVPQSECPVTDHQNVSRITTQQCQGLIRLIFHRAEETFPETNLTFHLRFYTADNDTSAQKVVSFGHLGIPDSYVLTSVQQSGMSKQNFTKITLKITNDSYDPQTSAQIQAAIPSLTLENRNSNTAVRSKFVGEKTENDKEVQYKWLVSDNSSQSAPLESTPMCISIKRESPDGTDHKLHYVGCLPSNHEENSPDVKLPKEGSSCVIRLLMGDLRIWFCAAGGDADCHQKHALAHRPCDHDIFAKAIESAQMRSLLLVPFPYELRPMTPRPKPVQPQPDHITTTPDQNTTTTIPGSPAPNETEKTDAGRTVFVVVIVTLCMLLTVALTAAVTFFVCWRRQKKRTTETQTDTRSQREQKKRAAPKKRTKKSAPSDLTSAFSLAKGVPQEKEPEPLPSMTLATTTMTNTTTNTTMTRPKDSAALSPDAETETQDKRFISRIEEEDHQ